MKVPVLLFHDISPDATGKAPNITISPERFRELLARLAKSGYVGISARDWLNAQKGHGVVPPKPVVITFDDGYASIAEYALPALKSHGFNATVFVVTGLIGRTNEWDRPKWRTLPLMDAEQLHFWAASGIEIGSHSSKHRDLTKLTESELKDEISSSHYDLASIVGSPIVSFAYPYGRHNDLVRRIASQTFLLAFSIQKGVITPNTDPMRCCRTEVMPEYSPRRTALYLRFAPSVGLFARVRAAVRDSIPTWARDFEGHSTGPPGDECNNLYNRG